MPIQIKLICAKCGFIEIHTPISLSFNFKAMDFMRNWREIDNMILCKTCVKDWVISFKKMKKDNKEKFLKN